MVAGPLVVELTLIKCHCRSWLFTLGQTPNLSLAWKKAGVFKMNGDDDVITQLQAFIASFIIVSGHLPFF